MLYMASQNCPVSWCTKQLSGEEPNKHSEDDHKVGLLCSDSPRIALEKLLTLLYTLVLKTCKLCEKAIPNYGDCKEYERHIDGCLEKCKNEFDQKERFSVSHIL